MTRRSQPTQEEYAPRTWELPHRPNLTGTPQAWRPPGSILAANARPPVTGDYEAWTPEG
jgi:NADH:ubiquinone oxidoreductase subunit